MPEAKYGTVSTYGSAHSASIYVQRFGISLSYAQARDLAAFHGHTASLLYVSSEKQFEGHHHVKSTFAFGV